MSKITRISSGMPPPGAAVQTIEGNNGVIVPPNAANNIYIIGDDVIVRTEGDSVAHSLTITTPGLPHTFHTDIGDAVAAVDTIDIKGDGNITTLGGGALVTINLNQTIDIAGDFHSTAGDLILDDGQIKLGASTGTDGQIPIAATGANPIWASLTEGVNVKITPGVNTITIAANSGPVITHYTSIDDTDSPYTALVDDVYIGANATGGTISVLLPDAPDIGREFMIKDNAGISATNNITITTVSGIVLLDAAATFVMNSNYQSASFIWNGVGYEIY